ncbi:hypothetical protein [Flavobacterium sp.]|uniref:hypothetical protein n=1 Tax=Flavobacterium sp. TaxID=239 RepID=UPI002D7EE750|nr:hypothetical protein [Flavobacterium sp.]
MNKSKNTKIFSARRNRSNRSFLSLLKRFGIKGNFSFDVFQYFKADYEELQIIYANIRV